MDPIKNAIRGNEEAFKRYEEAERRYLCSLGEDIATVDISLDLSEEELEAFALYLADCDLSMDEWAVNKLVGLLDAAER